MSSVQSERDRAIGVHCATNRAHPHTAPKGTTPRGGTTDITSRAVKSFLSALTALFLFTSSVGALPAAAVDVVANDITDVYEISGSIILDASFAEARESADCASCHWRILRTCATGPLEGRRNCLGIPCVAAANIAEVWRADAPAAPPIGDPLWLYRGLVCLTTPPIAVSVVSTQVRDFTLRALPALRPASQPASTTLTGLPTIFRSSQPMLFVSTPALVSGLTVTVRAAPTWTWDFGQGPQLITRDAGGAWPTGRVRHTYARRGIYRVRVTTTWRAVYTVPGIPDLPVEGDISQSAWFDLRVREARRFLHKSQGA